MSRTYSRVGVGSPRLGIDGCSAAAPHSTYDTIQPTSSQIWSSEPPASITRPSTKSVSSSAAMLATSRKKESAAAAAVERELDGGAEQDDVADRVARR